MKMKKALACVLALASAFTVSAPQSIIMTQPTAITASAASSREWGDNASYTVDATTKTVTVTGTGDLSGAPLKEDVSIKNVIIEEGITSIPEEAFIDCINLESVSIPSTVMSVGSNAFKNTAIYESYTDDLIVVDKWLVGYNYEKADEVTKIDIPEGTVGVADNVFWDKPFKELQEIAFPDSLMYIGSLAFSFGNQSPKLTELNLPTKNDLFIGDNAFCRFADNLTSLTIPSNVKKIGSKAFCANYGLETLVIKEGLTSIETEAFSNCSNLENVSLPESLINIKIDAFGGTKIFKEQEDAKQPLIFVDGWIVGSGGKAFGEEASEGTVGIAEYALAATTGRYGNAQIDVVILPDGIKYINEYAFAENGVIKSVNLPDSIVDIGTRAFYDCNELEEIILPSGITEIKDETFQKCKSATKVYIPSSIEKIGEKAFADCNSIITVEFGGSSKLREIGSLAFQYCASLEELILPSSVKSIGDRSFNGCSNIETLKVGDGVETISAYTFAGCRSIKNAEIAAKEISANAFDGIIAENITLTENVKKIEKGAFPTTVLTVKPFCDIQNMTILNRDCEIEDNSFASVNIYGYANSTAHTYADTNHARKYYDKVFNFIPLNFADINGDGAISIADAVTLQNYLLGKETFTDQSMFVRADLDGDGRVDVFDMVLMRQKLIEQN